MIYIPTFKEIRVNQDGTQINLIHKDGMISMPWEAALELARAITIQARRAEEIAKVEAIVYDQAILTRLGIPFGLTRNLRIMKEAIKTACWDFGLRRYIRGSRARGIESGEVFGTPRLIQYSPPKGDMNDPKIPGLYWTTLSNSKDEELLRWNGNNWLVPESAASNFLVKHKGAKIISWRLAKKEEPK